MCGASEGTSLPWDKALGANVGCSGLGEYCHNGSFPQAANVHLFIFCKVFRQLATPKNTGIRLLGPESSWFHCSTYHLRHRDLFLR